MYVVIILLIVLAFLALWGIAIYNALVKLNNRTKEGWSDIDVQLKRRHDLIPNLIASVKGYMQHERGVLERVTELRSQAISAQSGGDIASLANTESMLSSALGKLQIAIEAYPDLKANTTVTQLMDELSDTENKIQASRRFYNGMVRDFNTKIETFPNSQFAKMLSFKKYAFFEIENAKERENIEVKF